MIKPSIGRIVHYHAHKGAPEEAAIVTNVHDDRSIGIHVFRRKGGASDFDTVPLLQDADVAPEVGHHAKWMDYQKGQAAKTEQLEAAAKAGQ
jgi:hypothetical protein